MDDQNSLQALVRTLSVPITFGTWFAFLGAIWKLFDRIEKVANPKVKTDTYKFLTSRRLELHSTRWANTFVESFDAVYGSDHWSLGCFRRSCQTTLFLVLIGSVFLIATRPQLISFIIKYHSFSDWIMLCALLILNFFFDFVSLWQTRTFIGFATRGKFVGFSMLIIFLDFFASFIIIVFFYQIMNVSIFMVIVNIESIDIDWVMFWRALFGLDDRWEYHPGYAITNPIYMAQLAWKTLLLAEHKAYYYTNAPLLWSTFFTSLWIVIYILSVAFLRLTRSIRSVRELILRFLNVKDKPFLGIGVIIMFVFSIFYFPLMVVMLFF